jgi:hypothetical protein
MADRMDRIFNRSQDRSTNGVGSEGFDKHFGNRPNSLRCIPISPSFAASPGHSRVVNSAARTLNGVQMIGLIAVLLSLADVYSPPYNRAARKIFF